MAAGLAALYVAAGRRERADASVRGVSRRQGARLHLDVVVQQATKTFIAQGHTVTIKIFHGIEADVTSGQTVNDEVAKAN